MLAGAALIEAVVDALRRHALNVLVVDPVLAAHSGAPLLQDGALETLRTLLLPLATVLTPNIPEAELLLGRTITTLDDQREAAHDLSSLGACAVVIKGGHGQDPRRCVDVLCHRGKMIEIDSSRLDTANTHGGGCVFSAAITVYLARGHDVVAAVRGAHDFARRAIAAAWDAGAGAGPVNPLFQLGSIQN
jgi:hydroxymethylpyrimidine/phosphomethylpyrimidine kinase